MLANRLFLRSKHLVKCLTTIPGTATEKAELVVPPEGIEKPACTDPLDHPDYFGVNKLFTVRDLLNANVHYGHKMGSLNPYMKPFIYGSRFGHLIFDLDITAFHLRQALNFCAHVAYNDGIILFVSRNPRYAVQVEKTAFECKEFAHVRSWNTGLLTNSSHLFKTVVRLPDLVILLSTLTEILSEHPCVQEAAQALIPSIAICDTNSNPRLVTYPVPGDDDSPSAVSLYLSLFKKAILLGKQEQQRALV